MHHFIIYICFVKHAEVMVELLLITGHLRYLSKAQVIRMRFFKGENNMYKVPAQLCYPCNALMRIGYADHCFGSIQFYDTNIVVHFYEMIKQLKCML